uniref:Striated muscle enriched protein kinase b n=1 Tax=Astyanax mexicanus TaxID=7994 RepID=W5K7Y6_ASTMX
MQKAEVQMTLKKGAEDGSGRVAPPSPRIPSKRAKVNPDQLVPDPSSAYPTPTPPVFIRKMRNAAVGTGCDIRLKVAVAGDPQPSLYWYHNDDLLSMDNQEYGGLWIRDCKPADAGLYTCIATNHLGEARSSAVLAVLDLGEDSETTEDEAGEPQMETKEGGRGGADEASQRVPAGNYTVSSVTHHTRMMDVVGDARGHWASGENTVVEKEAPSLGSRAPGPHPSRQATGREPMGTQIRHLGVEPLIRASRANLSRPVWGSEESVSLASDYYGSTFSLYRGRTFSIPLQSEEVLRESPPHVLPPPSPKIIRSATSPMLGRSGSGPPTPLTPRKKAVVPTDYQDTVPGEFEEKIKQPKSSGMSQSSAQDSRPQTPVSEYSRKDLTLRPSPKLTRASSKIFERVRVFEERRKSIDNQEGSISGRSWAGFNRAPSIDSDEGGSRLGISRESSKEDLHEALKADAAQRRSMFRQRAASLEDKPHYSQKVQDIENKFTEELQRIKKLVGKPHMKKSFSTEQLSTYHRSRQPMRKLEPIPPQDRPRSPRRTRAESPSRNALEMTLRKVEPRPASPLVKRVVHVQEIAPVHTESVQRKTPLEITLRKLERRPESPLVQGETVAIQDPIQATSKPLRLSLSSSEEEKMEVDVTPPAPAPKLTIPQIIVEEEPMETETFTAPQSEKASKTSSAKEEKPQRMKGRGRRQRPMSPELESSDDSYVSAGEDPLEAPVFEFPLQDMVASSGAEVMLKCIIAGNPLPEVIWMKDNLEIRSSPTHVVKVEGERHTLLIKWTKPSDAGTYTVTATNEVGKVSCNLRGNLGVPMDVSSPITSDEEYLSPLEEGMDFGGNSYRGPEPRKIIDTRFKEPPTFQVIPLTDSSVFSVSRLRDRVTIKTGPRHVVQETESGTCEMIIKSAVKSDAGVYTCKIINEYGTKQCEGKLEVKAEPGLAIVRPVRDVLVKAGETAVFECHVIGPQDVDVDWLSDGKLIQPALLNCKMHFDGRRCRLLLNSVHEDDSGTYTCKLSTAKEELTSSAKLKVLASIEPLFTRKLDMLEVIEGRNARFDCKVSGTPPPKVIWSHFDHPLIESEDIRILKEGGRHSLVISHVSSDDEGFYTVVARNPHGEDECSAELYVQEPRPAISSQMAKLEKMPSIPEEPEVPESEVERFTMPDFVKPLYDLDVIEGKEAVLKCKVAGLPYPTISWFHNGKKIDSTEDRKMTQFRDIHSLVIRSVCHAHGGVYKSVISNKMGKATCYAHLYVTDVLPDPPDGAPVIESITGKTITLSWKKPRRLDPSIDPGTLMYAVQQQALGSIQWTIIASSLKQTTYTVTSLSKGVRYAFRILSITSKAFSKPSNATDPVQLIDRGPYVQEAPVIIDKPDVVYVVENQSVSITVTLNHVNANVTWKRRGVTLSNRVGLFEMSMPDDDQHMLKLCKVKYSDVGPLTFTASNSYGTDSCLLTLELAAPPTFESIMEDLDVSVGETPRFAVVVEGKPIPDIFWYKNDVLLSESSHFTFVYDDNECSLVVLNTQPDDSGVYTCTAKNLAGSVSCKAELTVHTSMTKPEKDRPMEDKETMLRRMRRLTDYYDVHKEIGRGAFSYVKRVTHKVGKMEYAAKFISARAKRKASALREMNILSHLDHERIIYFHDAFEKKNAVIIITEIKMCFLFFFFSVCCLQIRSSIRQILEGIHFLHQHDILHLDIKVGFCDFGNAVKITPDEAQYCKYGTPEFVAPEIVNQTPVSKATDIWPVGVLTYLCLTGVSPFAGENDRSSVFNIRNYNVAFEESMFADLCHEAKGFVIKLLVADRLRPDSSECLRHPWFKTLNKGKSISTEPLKKFLLRRKWQRSLISYKSKMVMRSIHELLDDSSNHISIAVPRHLKEGSPPPSSSSDSDEDIDELPFIPMPLNMEFSGSRMSLTDIHGDDEMMGKTNGNIERSGSSSQKSERTDQGRHRGELRRGSSADSALQLHIKPEEGAEEIPTDGGRMLKKSVSMELPRRSPSPGTAKMSQEDYALKLELMRQRLLRGGSADNKMSGLRGPLLETLGMGDEKRFLRGPRSGNPPLIRAASSESPRDDIPKTKVLRKSASFSQGDSEPMPLHRRIGAPLEIPLAQIEERRLQEAVSMSALAEQVKQDSRPITPKPLTPEPKRDETNPAAVPTRTPQSVVSTLVTPSPAAPPPSVPVYASMSRHISEPSLVSATPSSKADTHQTTEHPAVFSRVASIEQPAKEPSPPKTPTRASPKREPSPGSRIRDLASEEVFEARFKKRESSLTRGLKLLSWQKTEEKPSTVAPEATEEMYRPGPIGAPLEFGPRRLEEKSKSVQDLREAEKDPGFMRRLSMRLRRTPSTERKEEKPKEDDFTPPRRRLSWALGRRGSQDKKEVEMMRLDGGPETPPEPETKKPSESPVLAMRRKIGSTVSGLSMMIRSHSEERKDEKEGKTETKRTPILSILRRSTSEGGNLKRMGIPQNQLAAQSSTGASSESLDSMSSIQSESATERRSRWDRWGLTRGRRDKTVSQPDIPTAIARENGSLRSHFPPVFHIKLRDHVLLEGDPVTLSCLPAGSPHPHIAWMKDKKPLEIDQRMNMISCPDGRQLLMIMKTTKNDAGLYECVATNPLASISSSCKLSLARLPNRPGTPEVPQKYKNTALVVWRPSDTMSPCTYSLERRTEGESNWLIVATGVADCYYNVNDLPTGAAYRFRVACVNKAGQGPYSNLSEKVILDAAALPCSRSYCYPNSRHPPRCPRVPRSCPLWHLHPSQSQIHSKYHCSQTHPCPSCCSSTACSRQTLSSCHPPQTSESCQRGLTHGPNPPVSPPPLVSPPPSIGKPISSVPMYAPSTTTARVTPVTPNTPSPALSPPVVLVTSLSPVGEGTGTLSRTTPSGRATPSGRSTPTGRRTPMSKPGESTLRQGVPQKPYTFMDEKARGRFGVIRECRENATGNLFMAKIVPYEPESKQTVLQEYEILKSLHHDKIMALHEAYVTPRYLVLISECCAGKEILYSLIDRFRYSEDDVVAYIVQVLQGLDYLHNRRILHLDIKPDNIIVTYMNVVKIIDFGSAQTFNPLFLKQFSPPIGTLDYMSPEMLKGDVVGPPADIWSVGVMTFIMLSGRLPFTDSDPAETEARILAAKFDLSKLYQNVSQSASLFLKKILCSYPWARPSIKDCYNNSWLQDAYLMRLRRQTLTFTTTRLKEFLGQQLQHRAQVATKHKVLLRSYQSSAQTPTSPTTPFTPSTLSIPSTPSTPVTQ